tara:strand:- start:2784 stop:2951 length:168 start_codon:yes stop_codon:yes gene_type:complete
MNNKNCNKNQEGKHLISEKEINGNNGRTGVYLRDDHCDWGSSGMNEFTNEYSESK